MSWRRRRDDEAGLGMVTEIGLNRKPDLAIAPEVPAPPPPSGKDEGVRVDVHVIRPRPTGPEITPAGRIRLPR